MKRILFFKLCVCLAFSGNYSLAESIAPKLLPFQGRLTDQNGAAISNGVRLVQFKIFDVPTGGSPVWAGELHRTTVNGGLVNVLLGSKTPFTGLDFNRQLYLEITVDINGDNAISLADPPMLPRQAILPVIFATESANSRLLDGYDWTNVFADGATNPATAKFSGSRVVNQSITSTQLASNSVTASQLATGAVTSAAIASGAIGSQQISNGAVETLQIADGAVTLPKLAARQIKTNSAALGGIVFSLSSGAASFSISSSSETAVPNLTVTLVTTGRPVFVFLSSVEPAPPVSDLDYGLSLIEVDNSALNASLNFNIYRSTTLISRNRLQWAVGGGAGLNGPFFITFPPSCIQFIDSPPAGTNSYSVTISGVSSNAKIQNVRLVALEL